MKVFEKIAFIIQQLNYFENSNHPNANNMINYYDDLIEKIGKDYLPHGSGFDCGCTINLVESNRNKIVIDASYHHMNEDGYYDGWSEFKVILTSAFIGGYDIKIIKKGIIRKYRELSIDYFYDVFVHVFNSEFKEDK